MTDSNTARANPRSRSHPMEATSPWEWAVALLGLVLIVGAIGYISYYALTKPSAPPRITMTVESVEPNAGGYLATVKVANQGSTTAAGLLIEGELLRDGSAVETSEATIDYVPRNSERRAGLFFTKDPAQYRLELRPKGYVTP